MFKLILLSKEGKKFFVKDINADYHCQFGFVTAADLKKAKPGTAVKTNKGEYKFNGEEFKAIFSLRAPGALHIKSLLFNIEVRD